MLFYTPVYMTHSIVEFKKMRLTKDKSYDTIDNYKRYGGQAVMHGKPGKGDEFKL